MLLKGTGLLSYLQIEGHTDKPSQRRRELIDRQSPQHKSILGATSTQIATSQNLFYAIRLSVFSGHQLSLA